MKLRTGLVLTVILIVGGIALGLTIAGAFEPWLSLESLGVVRTTTTRVSTSLLQEMRDIARFDTVEYVYRTVFPHDYLPASTSIAAITNKVAERQGPLSETLTPEELLYLDAYAVAAAAGLDVNPADGAGSAFVVVTVVIRAGYDLQATVLGQADEIGDSFTAEQLAAIDRFVTIDQVPDPLYTDGRTVRRARLAMPPVEITQVVVEDPNSQTYRFPDIRLTPEHWREVAALVSAQVRGRAIAMGILGDADAYGRQFMTELLRQAGFSVVEFVPYNSPASNKNRTL